MDRFLCLVVISVNENRGLTGLQPPISLPNASVISTTFIVWKCKTEYPLSAEGGCPHHYNSSLTNDCFVVNSGRSIPSAANSGKRQMRPFVEQKYLIALLVEKSLKKSLQRTFDPAPD